ncbi:L-threonine ammonia-lyase [Thermomonospora echinospora]|uniref:L-threonine ammonia-lyase n=1 Tax=Thermomonospora echinospora TaxID=1992 RepID=A0A1H5XUZ4_9ACTN|nr:threonine/serine dehydratase [Thermomonospora echinospora]SEG15551.1 L-threonine ammonia-lyase [Thermomonospora echinospora]
MTEHLTGIRPVLDDVLAAADRIAPYARRTPVLSTRIDGRPVAFKLEHLQVTGSFKFRGALNVLTADRDVRHVVAASGGNHGLGVAEAARLRGLPARIYVPHGTPEAKIRRIVAAGAQVIRHGERYAEAEAAARAEAAASGAGFLHAYDDPGVIAGQGTVGLEIVEQVPGCDTVAVAVGGSGLAAGVSLVLGPGRTLVAVEPERCNALHAAFAAGEPVEAPADSIAASALGASRVGELPFGILRERRVRSVLVGDEQIASARDRLWEELRLAVEPAAAAPFAAWLAGQVPGEHPCLVLCGANTDWRPA